MKKTEKMEIDVDVYCSDFSNKEIAEFDRHFHQCVKCGRHMTNDECAETEDDGSLCKECWNAGFRFDYESEPGAVGIVDKDGNSVEALWL